MDNLSTDLITLLQYLLPGFISAWIFISLTSYPKTSEFERVIQALIFTLFIQAIVSGIEACHSFLYTRQYLPAWNESVKIAWSIITAVFIGFLFAYYANNDKLHKFFRQKKITRESSYPSEWFGAFNKDVTYIVLHLKDERRLYGWPTEWPSEPSKGHFVIEDPSWIDEGKDIKITGVNKVLIDVTTVQWVEFLEKTWEIENEQERV